MITKMKVADYVTLLNLISGILSIYFAFNNNLKLAAILILAGVIFDKLDGIIARALKQESDLGVQLDSFSDLITFGIAPAFLFVNLFEISYVALIALLLPICGALRLARFNITKKVMPGYFVGTPITINGIVFPVIFFFNANLIAFVITIIIMSLLMISNLKIKKVFG